MVYQKRCKQEKIRHLVYASSSSVYGLNTKAPFSTSDNVDHPVSLYAATKKANELMAHTYSYLYNVPTTGLRFFTVYGPWGRPDMALFKFTKAILNGDPIDVYNIGNSSPVALMDFIRPIEKELGKTARKNYLPLQPGDVMMTNSDVSDLKKDLGYKPSTKLEDGVHKFVEWYLDYMAQ